MFLPRVNGVSESKRACEANSWRRLRGLIAETRPLSHFWDLTNIQKYGDSINKQGISAAINGDVPDMKTSWLYLLIAVGSPLT